MDKPTFDKLWPAIYENHLKGKLVIAHNAKFDIGVLRATLDHYNIEWPELDFTCTVKISKRVWPDLQNHKLNTLAAYLGYEFKHHYALDDAEICAQVAIAAAKKRGVQSMEQLLANIGLAKESFITEDRREKVQEEAAGEQMSFF